VSQSPEAPLVSIVIPAYNYAGFLADAVDSVLAQSYPHIELIVLDDGSTDRTPEVLRLYDGRLRWESQPNMGQAATLNKGWAMARGDLLAYLSADDVLYPAAIGTAVEELGAADLVLVYPDYDLVDVRGHRIRTVMAPEFDYRAMVTSWICPPGPGALFRRCAAEAAGPWDTDLQLSPDYDFWLRLGLQGGARRIPKVLAAFRVHEESQSYRAVPASRSDEYQRVTEAYYAQPVPDDVAAARREALSNAFLLSARSHLRSGRYARGAARAAHALRLDPRQLRPRTARIIAHGLLNHVRYRRQAAAGGPA